MLIIYGGYEGVLLGLELNLDKNNNLESEINGAESKESSDYEQSNLVDATQSFRVLCSQGSIKCMSLSNNILVCGGSDETVQVYNIEKKRKHGEIMLSEGYITATSIYGGMSKGFILIGNEHGDISMFTTRDLSFAKSFKAHKKEITGLSIHPEGKTFISTSADRCLRLWDLVSKTCVFNTELDIMPLSVEWSKGTKYLLTSESKVLSCSAEDDEFETISTKDKVTSSCWCGGYIVLGFKSGEVSVYKESLVATAKVHTKRVKSISSKHGYIFTGDSDGVVLCFQLKEDQLKLIWKYDIGFRLNVLVC
ncbi:uncharacterized protein TOT_020000209 [Theileria orientalis strain Shintoku]|uniref:Uncharacterized protein n=1 Tax=Theileria orientalis strain Shintoku TaxID=869250 RepID=J4C803_THEOR|nr:uncharacterized protein TOT_020000209 [Theileria orientalis strain Shintoku]PVC53066.1 hypothetical protein MACL_00000323 [Theileria orientalis]BAM39938.1 uncharacterized protein TOT_020000209 [Theileria orientalis strain Shintoku]|eukprot:XP_009690239.1 uncharacterized protein TOT_020000209 [Theileria orientalis strain Shintoku]